MLKRKPAVGDRVRISPGPEVVAEAQVMKIAQGNVSIVVFMDPKSDHREPALIVETMDVRIRSGEWEILGNSAVGDFPTPHYLVSVGLDDQKWVQDFEGNFLRPAQADELALLRVRRSFSPAAVEEAIMGLAGAIDWKPVYDSMRSRGTNQ